jgi:hypothetical protein
MGFVRGLITGVEANRTVKDELGEAVGRRRDRRRISVTDLLNPRQAFFQRMRPDIKPAPERLQVMFSGTGFHELFGKAVSTEEYVEQYVELDGIVGKIDIYEDVPTELKTTGFVPDDIVADRSSYIDQLGMYCTMTRKPNGRLLVYKRTHYGRPPTLRAFDVAYADLDAIANEMRRRRDAFQHALESNDPGALPRCAWFDVGCDYADVCGCAEAVPLERIVPVDTVTILENDGLAASFGPKLAAAPATPTGFRLNDLVFPRKTVFERAAVETEEHDDEENVEERLIRLERFGFKGALEEALRFGVPGAFSRVRVELRTLKGWVQSYRGVPTILRAVRWRQMVERERLVEAFPHFFDRLAFECALCGRSQGRIVLYYEVLGEKFMVYDVTFTDLNAICAEADRRLALLEAGAPPEALPACPAWMAKFCSYAPGCGCGAAAS